ncbi:MAG: T9SS type A sorting domain-containing protein, partial [Bacteroidota bacterium]
ANLPSMPVYDAFIDFKNPNYILLGTDLGIYATETGGTVWEEQNSGMARVPVFEIRGYQWKPWMGSEIYIGTHGRGFFRSRSLMTNTHNTTDLVRTSSLNIYPNPAAAQTQLRFEALRSGKATLTVYTLNGQVAMRRDLQVKAGSQTIDLNVSGLANGHYLTVIDCAGEQKTGKMVVSR